MSNALAEVQQGEVLVDLKGFKELRDSVVESINHQKAAFIRLTIHGLEIGKQISDFANRADIRKEVDRLNKEKQDNKLGGRPKAYHCYVAELLVTSGVPVTKEWLEKCARAFERSKALGFSTKNVNQLSLKTVEALNGVELPIAVESVLPSPEGVFPPEKKAADGKKKKPTFKDFVRGFVARLEALKHDVGETSIRNKKHQEQWADAVEEWFGEQGVKVEITFKA